MSDAGNGAVRHGTAQFFCRYFFGRDRLDDGRARKEHVRCILDHEDKVHQSRAVYSTAGAGPHDDGNLRDDARCSRIIHENASKARQGINTFLDAGTAGIIDADDRRPHLQGHFLHLGNLVGMHFAKGTAFDGKIFGVGEDQTAADRTVAGNDAVAGDFLFLHVEIHTAMMDELPHFGEAAFIK